MPQYRQDFITKEWVIVAPERARRPDQFSKKSSERGNLPAHDPACPFCPGNESKTPPSTLVLEGPGGWRVRVVPNKFAAVGPDLPPTRHNVGRYLFAEGFGIAEVIVEHPLHNTSLAMMTAEEVQRVVQAFRERASVLAAKPGIDLVTIFRNHGARAGTSLIHPHSQIIATPIVPPHTRGILQEAMLYHDAHGDCPYCVVIAEELSQERRLVMESERFVVFCPWASRTPFEMRIMPRRHAARFEEMAAEESAELAEVLRSVLFKLWRGLGDPDYNLVVSTSPVSGGELPYNHWRIALIPRTTTPAGFEMGSGIFINAMPPEEAAPFLRSASADAVSL